MSKSIHSYPSLIRALAPGSVHSIKQLSDLLKLGQWVKKMGSSSSCFSRHSWTRHSSPAEVNLRPLNQLWRDYWVLFYCANIRHFRNSASLICTITALQLILYRDLHVCRTLIKTNVFKLVSHSEELQPQNIKWEKRKKETCEMKEKTRKKRTVDDNIYFANRK